MRRFIIFSLTLILHLPVWCAALFENESDSTTVEKTYILVKPERSGDGQSQKVTVGLDEPVRVMLVDENSDPVSGHPVRFKIIHEPKKSKDFQILTETAITDSLGIAETTVILGSKAGDYQIAARIEGLIDHDTQVYTFQARKSNYFKKGF